MIACNDSMVFYRPPPPRDVQPPVHYEPRPPAHYRHGSNTFGTGSGRQPPYSGHTTAPTWVPDPKQPTPPSHTPAMLSSYPGYNPMANPGSASPSAHYPATYPYPSQPSAPGGQTHPSPHGVLPPQHVGHSLPPNYTIGSMPPHHLATLNRVLADLMAPVEVNANSEQPHILASEHGLASTVT